MACSNFRTLIEMTVTDMQTHRALSSVGHDDSVLLNAALSVMLVVCLLQCGLQNSVLFFFF